MLLVGFVALIAAVGAGQKLIELRLAIDTRRDLKAFFNEYDVDKDGALNVKEFAILVSNLGVDVNYHELVACFNAMDKNDDELITYNEFNNWWTEWGKKNLQRSLSDVLV
jgi:Ca2+-binding EF-hand superfamily protein